MGLYFYISTAIVKSWPKARVTLVQNNPTITHGPNLLPQCVRWSLLPQSYIAKEVVNEPVLKSYLAVKDMIINALIFHYNHPDNSKQNRRFFPRHPSSLVVVSLICLFCLVCLFCRGLSFFCLVCLFLLSGLSFFVWFVFFCLVCLFFAVCSGLFCGYNCYLTYDKIRYQI